jgi:hypothetical protein
MGRKKNPTLPTSDRDLDSRQPYSPHLRLRPREHHVKEKNHCRPQIQLASLLEKQLAPIYLVVRHMASGAPLLYSSGGTTSTCATTSPLPMAH